MNYRIVHHTRYQYEEPVSLCHNQARLTPRSFFNQTCQHSHLAIDPQPATFWEWEDFFWQSHGLFFYRTIPRRPLGDSRKRCAYHSATPAVQCHGLGRRAPYPQIRD